MFRYAVTIFVSAFLLFQVQPLIAKHILPWYGGSPSVWTTCMLFFQALLVGGYLYAHLISSSVKPKWQGWIHLALLASSLWFLPIIPDAANRPTDVSSPVSGILYVLLVTVGAPYFMVSTTGPLLQRWFSLKHSGRSPYRLYALSNAGSLLALLSYPILFEPRLALAAQAWVWSAGYACFVLMCGWCSLSLRRPDGTDTVPARPQQPTGGKRPSRLAAPLWLLLAAAGSVNLLATTNQLCQDVTVVPFLWVLPLALYLLTFVLCFDSDRWYARSVFGPLFVVSFVWVTYVASQGVSAEIGSQVMASCSLLFCACMLCHGELSKTKPSPSHLTVYYLAIAVGGALGGLFVGVYAPASFTAYLEYPIALAATTILFLVSLVAQWDYRLFRVKTTRAHALVLCVSCLVFGLLAGVLLHWPGASSLRIPVLAEAMQWLGTRTETTRDLIRYGVYLFSGLSLLGTLSLFSLDDDDRLYGVAVLEFPWRPVTNTLGWIVVLMCATGILYSVGSTNRSERLANSGSAHADERRGIVERTRNFYGVLEVSRGWDDRVQADFYKLRHGRIKHGLQFIDSVLTHSPTSYYGPSGGLGLAIAQHPTRLAGRPLRLGMVGLGTGTASMWAKQGDYFRYYEINPAVLALANKYFDYRAYARQQGAVDTVVMGDARISMERELARKEPQDFDVLALDAFSGDAIPMHLLTSEAVQIYLGHLKPDGILAVHISNRHLNLNPVVRGLAGQIGYEALWVNSDPDDAAGIDGASWILVTKNNAFASSSVVTSSLSRFPPDDPEPIVWTDNYGSLFHVVDDGGPLFRIVRDASGKNTFGRTPRR